MNNIRNLSQHSFILWYNTYKNQLFNVHWEISSRKEILKAVFFNHNQMKIDKLIKWFKKKKRLEIKNPPLKYPPDQRGNYKLFRKVIKITLYLGPVFR